MIPAVCIPIAIVLNQILTGEVRLVYATETVAVVETPANGILVWSMDDALGTACRQGRSDLEG